MIRALLPGGRQVLALLALMLASAGAIRLGAGIGTALAAGDEARPMVTAEGDAKVQDCPAPPVALAQALKEREARISAQEQKLEERLAALDLADAAIRLRLDELKAAEDSLSRLISVADGAAEADLGRLTAVYEAMKPGDAAKLFAAMSPDFAAGFLGRMKPEAAAQILAGMTPEAAFAVSALIAGRNARAPTE